jgi:hypothetical protein
MGDENFLGPIISFLYNDEEPTNVNFNIFAN